MAQLMSIKKNVDVQPGVGVPAIFHCSQGDKGTRIILGLLNNNDTYTIPEGTTAIIRGSRADGTLFEEVIADIDTTTEVKFNLTEDITSVPGPVECEAVLSSGTANVIGTANFIIDVEKSPANIGSVIPGTDAAETWLIDELTNLDISSLDDESVVDAVNKKLDGTFETTDAGKVLMVNNDGTVSPAEVDLSGKASESTIAPEFDSSASYTAGQYVYKSGVLYRFTAAHTGAWTGTDAVEVTVGKELTDLKADLEEIAGGGSGLTAAMKQALLQIASKVAYIDDQGQTYYDDLYGALYAVTAIRLSTNSIQLASIGATSQLTATTVPEGGAVTWSSSNTSVATVDQTGLVTSVAYGSAAITASSGSVSATCSVLIAAATCTGITAAYTQSGTVYDSDSLDSLKSNLAVTASWSNGTTSTLTASDYTLSGTLTEGTSTITVSYGGKTTTFNVTVSASPYVQNGLIAYWDGINNTANGHDSTVNKWTDLINGYELTFIETTRTTWGNDAVILAGGGTKQGLYCDDFWTMPQDATIEIVIAPSESRTACVATFDRDGDGSGPGANVRRFAIFNDNTIGFVGASGNTYANPENSLLAIRKLVAEYTDFSVNRAFVNGTAVSLSSKTHSFTFSGSPQIRIGYENTASASYHFIGKIHAIRVYNRQLTTEELVKNLNYDNIRFSLGLTL